MILFAQITNFTRNSLKTSFSVRFCGHKIPQELDNHQITHLICVRLKLLLYDFLGGVLGLLPVVFLI